ncbi:bacteriohemerythrin [Pelosinus propionicus]|uniref:Hemerythrin-like metal-binding domain protein n=1 Tax=Pelosinus propionicus DSM 13327 TaxID=1123291 RepID=A0A1I4GLL6_9FIRM|nr:bacteriohemerythrin [Pelosinus propionicus]SFL30964.1 hemerythrin-like metal-binding domain protein [Pelosinus propionicus DSM 13327]
MEFFEWDESFSTKIQRFDDDHKKLLILFNNVYHRVFECENLEEERELTQETLVELLNYVTYHFSAEEELMMQFGYPQFLEHKKEHGSYIAEVNKFLDQHKKGAAALSFPTFMFLKEWIAKHILVRDKEYGQFFNDKGIR